MGSGGGLGAANGGGGAITDTYDYDYDTESGGAYQGRDAEKSVTKPSTKTRDQQQDAEGNSQNTRKIAAQKNATLMPTSANLSFGVKGWLASGLRVDSLTVDVRKSKGLGEGVKPYKGVKYLTASRKGIEVRC